MKVMMIISMAAVMMAMMGTASAAYDANAQWASGALNLFVTEASTALGTTYTMDQFYQGSTLNWDNDLAASNDANVRRCPPSTTNDAYVSECNDGAGGQTGTSLQGEACCTSDVDGTLITPTPPPSQPGYNRCHYQAMVQGVECGGLGLKCVGFFEWDDTQWVLPAANNVTLDDGQPAWAEFAPEFYAKFKFRFNEVVNQFRSDGVIDPLTEFPPGLCLNAFTREERNPCTTNQDCPPVFEGGNDKCYFYSGQCVDGRCEAIDLIGADGECLELCTQGNQAGVEICVLNKGDNYNTFCKSNAQAIQNICDNNPEQVWLGACSDPNKVSCSPSSSTGVFGGAASTTGLAVAGVMGVMAALVVGSFMYGRRVQRRQDESREMQASVELA